MPGSFLLLIGLENAIVRKNESEDEIMGLFSGLLGNASQKDIDKVERELENILTSKG